MSVLDKMSYYASCVNWPHDVEEEGGLNDMIQNARQIKRIAFLQHVNRHDLLDLEVNKLGYARDLGEEMRMEDDWHVAYYSSKLYGKRVYFFVHSSIEYVFKMKDK